MDNVAHTLMGYTLGKSILSQRKNKNPELESVVLWSSLIASNLPDIDSFIARVTAPGRLEYLLHHRGYSHTFLFLPVVAAISFLIASRLHLKFWKVGIFTACAAIGLHILADFSNNYGVHPFSPFYDHWFYGDFGFILEPTLWLSLLPIALFESKLKIGKAIWGTLEIGLLAIIWFGPYIPIPIRIFLTFWAALFLGLQIKIPSVKWPVLGSIGVMACFAIFSTVARDRIERIIHDAQPSEHVVQLALTPAPGDPLCFGVVSVTASGDDYIGRVGMFSFLPQGLSPKNCFIRIREPGMAPLGPSSVPESDAVHWKGQYQSKISEVGELAQQYCKFKEFLRFARAPFWIQEPDGALLVGDLRYDAGQGKSFAGFQFLKTDSCAPTQLKWEPPIASLRSLGYELPHGWGH